MSFARPSGDVYCLTAGVASKSQPALENHGPTSAAPRLFVPTLEDALARLDRLIDWERRDRVDMRVDVGPACDLLARLDRPERRFRAVHVAGTKGKGSVCALIEAGLRRATRRTGRYASPHVQRVNERIVIDGREISDNEAARVLTCALDARDAAAAAGTAALNASWFDVWTAAAFLAFAEAGVEWAAIECGIGGRLDSTNALDGEIAVLTNIDLEHTALLGDTRALIAREKLGILKLGRPLVTGVTQESEAGQVVVEVAREQGSAVTWTLPAEGNTRIVEINRAIANGVLRLVGVPDLSASDAVAVRLPGRLELFERSTLTKGVRVMLDGAHVPFNLNAVLSDLRSDLRFAGPCVVVMGLGRDKLLDALIDELAILRPAAFVATAFRSSLPPHEPSTVAARVEERIGVKSEVIESPLAALEGAIARATAYGPDAWVLVTGSLHVVGAVRGRLCGN
jgi:dihydrofolate synthase/folylpolyglutamate synthase